MSEKILIIEDEEEIRSNLQELLKLINYEVITAENGKQGIQLAHDALPDLVICDILMPQMDGYEVYEALQQSIKTQLIPFIFLTAKADLTDIRKGMQLGADDYIVKPYSSEDIMKSVRKRLDKSRQSVTRNKDKKNSLSYDESIMLSSSGDPYLVNIKDIVFIQALNQYCEVNLSDKKVIKVRKSLKEWEEILPETFFLRIHRSTLVNKSYILKIEKWYNKSLIIKLRGLDLPLSVSQRYTTKLKSNSGNRFLLPYFSPLTTEILR